MKRVRNTISAILFTAFISTSIYAATYNFDDQQNDSPETLSHLGYQAAQHKIVLDRSAIDIILDSRFDSTVGSDEETTTIKSFLSSVISETINLFQNDTKTTQKYKFLKSVDRVIAFGDIPLQISLGEETVSNLADKTLQKKYAKNFYTNLKAAQGRTILEIAAIHGIDAPTKSDKDSVLTLLRKRKATTDNSETCKRIYLEAATLKFHPSEVDYMAGKISPKKYWSNPIVRLPKKVTSTF